MVGVHAVKPVEVEGEPDLGMILPYHVTDKHRLGHVIRDAAEVTQIFKSQLAVYRSFNGVKLVLKKCKGHKNASKETKLFVK